MRHQGVPKEVFAPSHLTLCSTGAQAHPEASGGGEGVEVMLMLGDSSVPANHPYISQAAVLS